ncbi:MAG: VCBS repeat-containing protein [Nitrospiraceae bacterium]|nr:MAG: VCBS repeat-containing protein [Nitrospiraceae bacterium]
MRIFMVIALSGMALAAGCSKKDVRTGSDTVQPPPVRGTERPAPVRAGVSAAGKKVLAYFEPLNGLVTEQDGTEVTISLDEGGPVRRGMRLSVYREGEPFYHPVTNELIGRTEEFVGRIETAGEEGSSGMYPCTVLSGDVREGDRARISSSKIKLAFFQDRKANWPVSEAFYNELRDSGRFELVESYAPDINPDSVLNIAGNLRAEAVLILSTPLREGARVLSAELYWVEDRDHFASIEEKVQDAAAVVLPEEEFIVRSFTDREPWRKLSLPGGQLVAMGDVDGNGTADFIVSDGRDIQIYSVDRELRELWNIKGEGEGEHLSLDVLDCNANGRAEIFVTSVVNAGKISPEVHELYTEPIRVNSFVLEFDPSQGYERIADNIPYFLRVMGKTLLMQGFNAKHIFRGPVYSALCKDQRYMPGDALELPEQADIYGFTYVDWNSTGVTDLLTFDSNGHLYLYGQDGHLKWRSPDSYGPFPFSFESRTTSPVNRTVKWSLRGRLSPIRTDRGQEIVVLKRSPLLPNVPGLGIKNARVFSLWWDGGGMDTRMVLDEIPGAVTDFWIQGRDLYIISRGGLYTLFGNLIKGELSKGSMLYFYSFAPLENAQ